MIVDEKRLASFLAETLQEKPSTPLDAFTRDNKLLSIWTLYKMQALILPAEAVGPVMRAYGSINQIIGD